MTSVALIPAAIQLLLRSWRGQLVVLGLGTLILAPTLNGLTSSDDLQLRSLVLTLELIVLLGAGVRAAHACDEDVFSMRAVDELVVVVQHLPRLLVQVLTAAAPAIGAAVLAMLLGSLHPLLGLLAIPVAFVVITLCAGPMLVACAAVMRGEQRWLPQTAWGAVRPVRWRVALDTFVGIVLACVTALPLLLVAMVVMANAGVVAFVGIGIAGVATIPWMSCWAVALWRSLGAPVALHSGDADGHDELVVEHDRSAALESAFGLEDTASAEPTWVDGPAWDVAVEAGAVWGTWVRLDRAGQVGFRVAFNGAPAPDLLLCGEDQQWYRPGALAATGDVVMVQLPAGNTYVQLGTQGSVAQAISLTMLVPGHAAA